MSTLLSSPAAPGEQTLARFRLRRHADYQLVYKASRKYHAASLSYFFRLRTAEENPQPEGPRVGLTVGRVMGKAVDRNRIKRRMREAVRLNLFILRQAPPDRSRLDVVLHPRKEVATMDFAALQRELIKVFTQVVAMAATPQPPPGPRLARSGKPRKPGLPSALPPASKLSGQPS